MNTLAVKTLAVIPARGGSTRIPRKNLALLAGQPLIVHTIDAALAAEGVTAVCVSTNDPEIASVAVSHGAELVWRPHELATAEAPTEPALIHALHEMEERAGHPFERIVLLQPTSPLRPARAIEQGLQLLDETGCDSVASVVADVQYYFLGDLGPGQRLALGYDPGQRLRTQDIPPRYRENGALYITRRSLLLDQQCRMGGDMRALLMEEEESIDIDHPLDLQLCELLLARRRASDPKNVLPAALGDGQSFFQT